MLVRFSLSKILALFLILGLQAVSAEVTWDQVKKKVQSAKDYTVTYKYNGPSGIFDFDYRFAGDKVRTEIKDSKSDPSRRGTVIVFDKSWAADKVRAKTGGGMIVRNLTHKDVAGKPFYQSLFGMILDQTANLGKPTATASGSDTKFTFKAPGGSYQVWANSKGEIIKTERKDGKEDEKREFLTHSWNTSPKMDF